jgi:hypothetical protein
VIVVLTVAAVSVYAATRNDVDRNRIDHISYSTSP